MSVAERYSGIHEYLNKQKFETIDVNEIDKNAVKQIQSQDISTISSRDSDMDPNSINNTNKNDSDNASDSTATTKKKERRVNPYTKVGNFIYKCLILII